MIFIRFITVSVFCLFFGAAPAFAHKLSIDWRFDHGRLHVEAFYDDDTPAQSARIVVESGMQIVAEGKTDDKGVWSCPTLAPGSYRVRAESVGHAASKNLTISSEASSYEEKRSLSHPDKAGTAPSETTGWTEKNASRPEATETPWLQVIIGFAVIAGLCCLWKYLNRNPREV